ncbi:MAG TPA: hypothetical protein VGM98_18705 [Schlesneria sp.]|jgi:hypothetical protein
MSGLLVKIAGGPFDGDHVIPSTTNLSNLKDDLPSHMFGLFIACRDLQPGNRFMTSLSPRTMGMLTSNTIEQFAKKIEALGPLQKHKYELVSLETDAETTTLKLKYLEAVAAS